MKVCFFKVLVAFCLIGFLPLQAQVPTDNPYLTKYDSCPLWMHELKWDYVVDIHDYRVEDEQTWDSAAKLAMSVVYENGGGILYFPAGEYRFESDLALLDGVILRGQTPVNQIAKEDDFAPPTRFVFPKYEPVFEGAGTPNSTAFKRIYALGDKSNIGLVYLDINRGRIHLSVSGQNLMLFGIRQNNVAEPQSDIPKNYPMMFGWQRFAYRHGRNIRAYAARHVSVANCRINDFENNTVHPLSNDGYDQPGAVLYGHYKGDQDAPSGAAFDSDLRNEAGQQIDTTHITHGDWYRFSYTDHYGMGVGAAEMNPASLDQEINQHVEVIDNWVYNTMRVGIFAQGIGLRIAGNVRLDESDKRNFIHATGYRVQTNNAATMENRALNFAGNDILIEDNDLRVYRHKIMYTGYATIDGEGILIQTQDIWGDYMDKVFIRNNKVNSYIGIYDMKMELRNIHITGNDLMDKGNILLFKKEIDYRMDNIFVEDNFNVTSITLGWRDPDDGKQAKAKGTNIVVRNNAGSSSLNYPCQSVVNDNIGFTDITHCEDTFRIIRVAPYNGQLNVSSSGVLEIQFNQAIQSMGAKPIILRDSKGTEIPVSVQADSNLLTCSHTDFVYANETYTATLADQTVYNESLEGNSFWEWQFTTMPKPYLLTTLPSDKSQAVSPSLDYLAAAFNQSLTMHRPEWITLMKEDDSLTVPLLVNYDAMQQQLRLTTDALEPNTCFQVMIPYGVMENEAGFWNDTLQWSFCTGDSPPSTGINRNHHGEDENAIRFYPNPTSHTLYVQSPFPVKSYKLLTLQGKILEEKKYMQDAEDFSLSVESLAGGAYLMHIQGHDIMKGLIFFKE